ncbi:MAG TPA: GFA family protein [Rhizomicrobium sp.]|jgi:hypothetical protein
MDQTYSGSCHCGRVRFEIDTELDHVRVCDCSICRRRGALLHRVDPDRFRLLTALEDMTLYTFNTHTARDCFCPTCGILPFRRPRTAPEAWSVNVRCLDNVDIDSIPVKRVYGSRLS